MLLSPQLITRRAKPVVAAAAGMQWSATNKTAGMTISGGNLIATAASANDNHVRSTNSFTGKGFFSITLTTLVSSADAVAWGCCNSSYPITDNTVGVFGTNMFAIDGGGNYGGSSSGFDGDNNAIQGTVLHIAVDQGGGLWWIKKGSGDWNGDATHNPTTGVGGKAFTTTGALFAIVLVTSGANGSVWTINSAAVAPTDYTWIS